MLAKRFFLGLIVALNVFLLYRVLLSDQGVFAYNELRQRQEELSTRLQALTERNLELSRQIRLLKDDRQYIETIIRQQMHFVKEDEILYVFTDNGTASPPGAGAHERKD
ncbi:MAG: septum formation initiator family protein [Desulfovibrionaceae bacterium]|jgi:cell division protein FtsB|nr:septum formation initiator family protein [Desulfovibrionaceae bacterium]